jgi:hypothetical protein
MIGTLPHERESATNATLANACLEAWLIHVRLMAEYLLVRPSDPSKDFSARDFGWRGPTAPQADIENMWMDASQYIVHFGKARTPPDLYDLAPLDVSISGLTHIAESVFALADEFVAYLHAQAFEESVRFGADLNDARAALARTSK